MAKAKVKQKGVQSLSAEAAADLVTAIEIANEASKNVYDILLRLYPSIAMALKEQNYHAYESWAVSSGAEGIHVRHASCYALGVRIQLGAYDRLKVILGLLSEGKEIPIDFLASDEGPE